jgi:hypoxanthine phosphoribosyltransferase
MRAKNYSVPFSNHALFRLKAADHVITEAKSTTDLVFDPISYSQYKYGDGATADDYACSLLELFEEKNVLSKDEHYFLCGSAYKQAPTAAISIAQALFNSLLDKGYRVNSFKVNGQSYTQDYSELSASDRGRMLANIRLSLDDNTTKKVKGKKVIVIDDIRITGLHQKAMRTLLTDAGAQEVIFGYVAILNKKSGQQCSKIEWHLNHQYVDSLDKLSRVMVKDQFLLNARICKYILGAPKNELADFLKIVSQGTLMDLLHMIEADGYHNDTKYVRGYLQLQKAIRKQARPEVAIIRNLRRIPSLDFLPAIIGRRDTD